VHTNTDFASLPNRNSSDDEASLALFDTWNGTVLYLLTNYLLTMDENRSRHKDCM
jgi:hypothetical protein